MEKLLAFGIISFSLISCGFDDTKMRCELITSGCGGRLVKPSRKAICREYGICGKSSIDSFCDSYLK